MKKYFSTILVILVLSVVYSGMYTVSEIEQVVVTRFGDPVGKPVTTSGLHFKIPFVDKANVFDKRMMEWDGDMYSPIQTLDKQFIIVSSTARWRIVDALLYFSSFRGIEANTYTSLDDVIDAAVKNVIGRSNLGELVCNSNRVAEVLKKESQNESFSLSQGQPTVIPTVSVGREQITRQILGKAGPAVAQYGIELVDVRIKGLMYSDTVLKTVYQEMISYYNIKAQNLLSQGEKRKSMIEGETEFEVKKIRSEAYKKAQTIRGEGDAEAARIYAETLNKDADFYHFMRSLESYQPATENNTTMVLSTDSEFFRVMNTGKTQ